MPDNGSRSISVIPVQSGMMGKHRFEYVIVVWCKFSCPVHPLVETHRSSWPYLGVAWTPMRRTRTHPRLIRLEQRFDYLYIHNYPISSLLRSSPRQWHCSELKTSTRSERWALCCRKGKVWFEVAKDGVVKYVTGVEASHNVLAYIAFSKSEFSTADK